MRIWRFRAPVVVAAGATALVGAVGLSQALAAPPLVPAAAAPCKVADRCGAVEGRLVGKVLPPGLAPVGEEIRDLPGEGAKRSMQQSTFAAGEKLWVNPGGQTVGRRITVQVISSDQEEAPLPDLPEGVQRIQFGANTAYASETSFSLPRAGARASAKGLANARREQVPVSTLSITLSGTKQVVVLGEGVTLKDLQAFARTLEVR